jgi:hypothetical protein
MSEIAHWKLFFNKDLVSTWNLTGGPRSGRSPATEHDMAYEHFHLNEHNEKRPLHQMQQRAQPLSYTSFFGWLTAYGTSANNQSHDPAIFHLWSITVDGSAGGDIYHMRTKQARHTRQTALAQDPSISR